MSGPKDQAHLRAAADSAAQARRAGLARAGLAPLKVLQMTTVEAGRFLGLDDLGVVQPGARADLVLLDGDPTTHVANLHRVAGVVRAGRHLAPADLDSIRERVAAQRSAG